VIEVTCTRCQSLTVSSCAANQFRALEPNHVVVILDALRGRSCGPGSHLVEVAAIGTPCRCFVARYKGHARIWLSVVERRGP